MIQTNEGKLRITTTTPGGDTGEPANALVPKLKLYSPTGVLVASNQNGASDGRNAQIVFQVPTGGEGAYRLIVSPVSGGGDYTVSATGTAVVAKTPAPTVVTTSPTDGARLAALPAFIDVTFSEGVRVDSVSATDLTIDGGATVTEVQALDGRTFRFAMSVPNVPNVDTTYTVTLSAGAISDLQSNTNATFAGAFIVDHVGPRIIPQTPAMQISSPGIRSPSHSASRSTGSFTSAAVVLTGPNGNIPMRGRPMPIRPQSSFKRRTCTWRRS